MADKEVKSIQSEKNVPLFVKILIPIIIVGVIIGLFFIKNGDKYIDNKESNTQTSDAETLIEASVFELHVTEEINLEELKSYGLPIMIDFGADSCVPCKEMAPVLEKLNEELQGKAIILFVDVWKYQELAVDYPIRVIPTQVFIDSDGNAFIPSDNLDVPLLMYASNESGEHVFTIHEGGIIEDMILEILEEMGLDR